jgi:dolichol-phosphate mannosyltransferase
MVKSLSVVLPAFNESGNIAQAVSRALEVLPDLAETYEVIVVDDGSSDDTAEVALDIARSAPAGTVRVLQHRRNSGYGAAIRSGLKAAGSELVFYTDADNQFDIGELHWLMPSIEEADVVVGFRVYRYDTALRSFLSWAYNLLVTVLFRVRVRDVDCAFKLFRREVLEKIHIDSEDFFVDTELVARARKWNFRIVEKGVRHYPRMVGETTVRAGDIPRTLKTVGRMWRRIYFPTREMLDAAAGPSPQLDDNTVELTPVNA